MNDSDFTPGRLIYVYDVNDADRMAEREGGRVIKSSRQLYDLLHAVSNGETIVAPLWSSMSAGFRLPRGVTIEFDEKCPKDGGLRLQAEARASRPVRFLSYSNVLRSVTPDTFIPHDMDDEAVDRSKDAILPDANDESQKRKPVPDPFDIAAPSPGPEPRYPARSRSETPSIDILKSRTPPPDPFGPTIANDTEPCLQDVTDPIDNGDLTAGPAM